LSTKPALSVTRALSLPDGRFVRAGVGDQLDPGDEGGRVGEVHAQEAVGVLQVRGEPADGQGRGVGADDGVRAGGGLDGGQHRTLDRRVLGDGLLDEVRLGDGLGQALGGPHVGLDQIRRPRVEEALVLEGAGLLPDPVELAPGGLGVGVGDGDLEAGDGQHLGDAAAHVAGADDGDVADAHPQQTSPTRRTGAGSPRSRTRGATLS
jgi:hypothetical protein